MPSYVKIALPCIALGLFVAFRIAAPSTSQAAQTMPGPGVSKLATDVVSRADSVKINGSNFRMAEDKALETISVYWDAAKDPQKGEGGFAVKVEFALASAPSTAAAPAGASEALWVARASCDANDACAGILTSARSLRAGKKTGDKVAFHKSQICDWMFMRNGKIVGNETMRRMLKQMPAEKADRYRLMLADSEPRA